MTSTTDADPLAGLNAAQRQAVEHVEGPLLVVAGAGSGKTRVLTTRIARLIDRHGVDPRHILAVTFTNKAAAEMRERIARLLGDEPAGLWAGTFHAVGARLLRSWAPHVGRGPNFTIYGEDESLSVVKQLMERHRIAPKQFAPKSVAAAISDAMNALVSPTEYQSLAHDPFSRAAALVYQDREGELRARNAAGFDDLLVLPVRVLESDAGILAAARARFRFVLVDEYQDTNRAQYRFVRLLAGDSANVMVVGDDDQSIYAWRGADIRNILDFGRDFPQARTVRLEENYRSTPRILAVANAVIAPNRERLGKTLRATRDGGEPVTVAGALDERDEADWVVEEIAARRATEREISLRDFAVLYRTNAQSRAFEEALRRRGVPYRLVGAVRFYDRREIRDLLAYLRLVANPADDEAFRRAVGAPRRGIGEASIDTLAEQARAAGIPLLTAAGRPDLTASLRPSARAALAAFAETLQRLCDRARDATVDALLQEIVDAVGYTEALRAEGPESVERIENVRELIAGAVETAVDSGGELGLTPLDAFLQRATLVADLDTLDAAADGVTMMTLHNAKGLEFPVVFVAGLEDGLFPLARAFDDPPMLEEERRLLYVGVTRAETKLYLTHARSRRRNGETLPSIPSSFLAAIPPSLLDQRATMRLRATGRTVLPTPASARRSGLAVSRGATRSDDEVSQDAPRFVTGERVRHRRFGSGTIADFSGTGRDVKVTVDFDDESVGRKRLVVAYAGLERGCE